MAMECTDSTQGTFMQENGQTGRAMGVEFTPVKMGVDMSGNSSGVLNMDWVITISGNSAEGNSVDAFLYPVWFAILSMAYI